MPTSTATATSTAAATSTATATDTAAATATATATANIASAPTHQKWREHHDRPTACLSTPPPCTSQAPPPQVSQLYCSRAYARPHAHHGHPADPCQGRSEEHGVEGRHVDDDVDGDDGHDTAKRGDGVAEHPVRVDGRHACLAVPDVEELAHDERDVVGGLGLVPDVLLLGLRGSLREGRRGEGRGPGSMRGRV